MTDSKPQASDLQGKELAFALAWIELGPINGRGPQAAVKAGYAPKSAGVTASKLLRKPKIEAYIRAREEHLVSLIEDKQLVTRELIISRLHKIYEQCMRGEPEMIWENGELVHSGLWTFDSKGACRAVELLGKTIHMFADKSPERNKEPFNLNIILTEPQKNKSFQGTTVDHFPDPPKMVGETPTINLEQPA
jgi:phage terminase small subunit